MYLGSTVAIADAFGGYGYRWKESVACFVSFGVDCWLEAFVCFEISCSALSIGIVFGAASTGVRALSSSPGCCYRR